ncbi:hypothetical protein Axy22_061 [Achromobacter phage vB_AxyP_19-32_Axy22]|uniref:Uncharacterized protein n=2 Tax=Pourcelvirus TaxID=2842976 RepID=A0A514CVX4_9CAUD|nr:hypothetical protein KMC59_gp53 [Achromobacter phage vB_AxyP_19-32_Axy10]QDH83960.1 hypothetical protein Axy10_065 [Achromobacter phage vB_AxyP_19-32_Axy10]QDH84637.1 hypothetical protein Axy22_061 [Achromobacter phage vB_AxyP_19-32_Axy22]
MSQERQIAGLEHQIAQSKKARELNENLRKLMGNALFRKVIIDGFCGEAARSYLAESIDPTCTPDQRANALGMAQASAYLRAWLAVTEQLTGTASASIPELEAELERARQPEEEDPNEYVG